MDLEALAATNEKLVGENSRLSALIRRNGVVGEPLARYQIQSLVMDNLRILAAARDQFRVENGRWPTSIGEIVGGKNYANRLIPVDGEDYTSLTFGAGAYPGSLTVTTTSGITVKYADYPDTENSPIDYPPEVIRVQEMEAKIVSARQTALETYRILHEGKDPPNEKALTAYFKTPQQAADFIEFLDLKETLSGK